MYERICENAAIAIGCRIGYYSGDVRNLLDDMQALRPTVVAMVPRVLDRIYDRVRNFILHINLTKMNNFLRYFFWIIFDEKNGHNGLIFGKFLLVSSSRSYKITCYLYFKCHPVANFFIF